MGNVRYRTRQAGPITVLEARRLRTFRRNLGFHVPQHPLRYVPDQTCGGFPIGRRRLYERSLGICRNQSCLVV